MLFTFLLLAISPLSKAAGTLEEGMSELAEKISKKSMAKGKKSIAISYFLHTNGDQSELSNYLADELVLKLFDVPESNLEIVERSQLSQIFKEMNFNMTGVVDSKTIQELGKVHGVGALVLGSITEMGESIRINARLTDTETGRVFSAAGTTIPKTATIKTLLTNIITKTNHNSSLNRNVTTESAVTSSSSNKANQQSTYKIDLSKYAIGDMPEELGMVTVEKGKSLKGKTVVKSFQGGAFEVALPNGGLHGNFEINLTGYLVNGNVVVDLLSLTKNLHWFFTKYGTVKMGDGEYKRPRGIHSDMRNDIKIKAIGRVVKFYLNNQFIGSQIQDPKVIYKTFKIGLRKMHEITKISFIQN